MSSAASKTQHKKKNMRKIHYQSTETINKFKDMDLHKQEQNHEQSILEYLRKYFIVNTIMANTYKS